MSPIEGHEIRIVDDKNSVLPERHVGNLQFRGPSSMQGYYHNPARLKLFIMMDGLIPAILLIKQMVKYILQADVKI